MKTEFLTILRCPIDPRREAALEQVRDSLQCQRCRTSFTIKNGIPVLLVDEADLPDGCPSIHKLPCQQWRI